MAVLALPCLAKLDANPRDQLVEREGLAQIVGGPETESAQLRLQVRARGHDHDRQLGARVIELVEDAEPVEPREQQIEQDEVVVVAARALETLAAVAGGVNGEALALEPPNEEAQDSRFVLDHQDPHCPRATLNEMT